ncbi:MAG: transposase [Spirochaetaceae bacterium]|nr:transposase [Spirochaetaceae bacterium]
MVLPDKSRIPVRICVKRKDKEGCEESRKRLYRRRRQVEIHFKRLKSIPDFRDLPKKNPAASEAWLNGKIMAALLIEAFIAKASFSPCNRIE